MNNEIALYVCDLHKPLLEVYFATPELFQKLNHQSIVRNSLSFQLRLSLHNIHKISTLRRVFYKKLCVF